MYLCLILFEQLKIKCKLFRKQLCNCLIEIKIIMATITLRPDVYDKAAILARKDKLNIEDWVNKILQKIVVDISEKEDMKAPAESKMFSWDEMGGMFASDKSDKELRDEYLEEKYGI